MIVITKKILAKVKIPLAIASLFALAWGLAEFITLIEVKVTTAPIALAIGIVLGMVTEIKFGLETLFVGGGIILMSLSFFLMVLLLLLPPAWFKLIFILVSVATVGASGAAVTEWLIKNWLCKGFGKLYGVLIAAIAIGLGIMSGT